MCFTWKLTEESNENIDFAIDTPPQCLTIPLNCTPCDEGNDLLKTKLGEQLIEIRKCHHQKYLNAKPTDNNIRKSNCLEQKCELIIEKMMTIGKLAVNIKLIVKSQLQTNSNIEKANSRGKPPPEKSTNFHKIQRNFHNSENNNNEENRLKIKIPTLKIIILKITAYI